MRTLLVTSLFAFKLLPSVSRKETEQKGTNARFWTTVKLRSSRTSKPDKPPAPPTERALRPPSFINRSLSIGAVSSDKPCGGGDLAAGPWTELFRPLRRSNPCPKFF
ncbi:hypothetical protein N658DRAFT_42577 [Parathielavia hyrcaniae]|uniref:Secreted protein n=1 Tax=Parathielavia hyrcaniae TaxID=113614 RepID=A0AAN6Q6L1_9PEZI|nr:hypothetical protein N658DRAFT_42577 [Parathielavia hyrcaniae]